MGITVNVMVVGGEGEGERGKGRGGGSDSHALYLERSAEMFRKKPKNSKRKLEYRNDDLKTKRCYVQSRTGQHRTLRADTAG